MTRNMNSALSPNIPEPFSLDENFNSFINDNCELLAEGTSRKVCEIKLNDEFVIKVATNNENIICNWIEIAAYHGLEDKSRLARVSSWSISGRYLVMEKLDMTTKSHSSFVWPLWVTDRKPTNIGMDKEGNPKICDYALVKPSNSCPASIYE